MVTPLSGKPRGNVAFPVEDGSPHPLGATPSPSGVNFSLFSSNATGIELLLFSAHDSLEPFQTIRLDPYMNKTFHFWHAFVPGLKPGVHYAYRVDGPFDSAAGQRSNRNKVLIDPYARGNSNSLWDRGSACTPEDNMRTSIRSVVIDPPAYAPSSLTPPAMIGKVTRHSTVRWKNASSTRRMSAASRNLLHRAFGIPGLSPALSKRFLISEILALPPWSCFLSLISTKLRCSESSMGSPSAIFGDTVRSAISHPSPPTAW